MASINEILRLKGKIDKLDEQEYIEIFKLIYKSGCKYTQNLNGVFLDLNGLDDSVINQLRAFLDFVEANRKHIKDIEDKISLANADNKYCERVNPYENTCTQQVINNDYSQFVTELTEEEEELFEQDEMDDDIKSNNNVYIENDDDNLSYQLEDDEDNISIVEINDKSKKKKMNTVCTNILRMCKNISTSNYGDIDDEKVIGSTDEILEELSYDKEL